MVNHTDWLASLQFQLVFCIVINIMPITSSAKKALRSSRRKRVFNVRRQEAMKKATKEVKKVNTKEALAAAYKAIDKAAKRGVLKKNTASRKKSRLSAQLKKISQK